jgi:hypothetical protein
VSLGLRKCDNFVCRALTVSNTISTVVDDIIPFGSRVPEDKIRYYKFSYKNFYGRGEKIWSVG